MKKENKVMHATEMYTFLSIFSNAFPFPKHYLDAMVHSGLMRRILRHAPICLLSKCHVHHGFHSVFELRISYFAQSAVAQCEWFF